MSPSLEAPVDPAGPSISGSSGRDPAWPQRAWLVAGLLVGWAGAFISGESPWESLWQLPAAGAAATLVLVLVAWGLARVTRS
ncbi:hypothetical protein Poly30_26610 [Planctomycetes bacterium Poly30]|uniref:Uncharacterized protein n=2 Tax=Saltatorellus ferox TaxID=2528018 RepID=A0A518ESU6_9BACT|nr:hypothetical protein Poly30_26610 [Planctomycetes bacterium Poly30]